MSLRETIPPLREVGQSVERTDGVAKVTGRAQYLDDLVIPGVVYAAVDTHRLDDFAPHLYRTRDSGRTWTAISSSTSAFPAYGA